MTKTLTSIDHFQKILGSDEYLRNLQPKITNLDEAECVITIQSHPSLIDSFGNFKGFVVLSLMDITAGFATVCHAKNLRSAVTFNYNMNVFTALKAGTFEGRARVLSMKNTISIVQCDAYKMTGSTKTLVASAQLNQYTSRMKKSI